MIKILIDSSCGNKQEAMIYLAILDIDSEKELVLTLCPQASGVESCRHTNIFLEMEFHTKIRGWVGSVAITAVLVMI